MQPPRDKCGKFLSRKQDPSWLSLCAFVLLVFCAFTFGLLTWGAFYPVFSRPAPEPIVQILEPEMFCLEDPSSKPAEILVEVPVFVEVEILPDLPGEAWIDGRQIWR